MTRGHDNKQRVKALRVCAGALLLALLAGCASAPAPTMMAAASKSKPADPKNGDGIGGTGIFAAIPINSRGDGIGGTGVKGTITGFGSILVNGLKLEFDHTTNVESDGKPTTLDALRVGQIVEGVARTKDGKLSLATLEIQHAVTGPIGAIDHNAQTLTVLGQRVRVNLAGDRDAVAAFRTLRAGDVVSVSGLRQADGLIIATRVDEAGTEERIMLRGTAGTVGANSVRVGDLEIALAPGAAAPKAGEQVFAAGRMINGQFTPDVVLGKNPLSFDKDVTDVSLEAYAPQAAGNTGPLVIDGISITGTALPAGTALNDHIVVAGKLSGPGAIAANSITTVRTMVTINAAKGSLRPAAVRNAPERFERVAPRPNIERPQGRPDTPAAVTRPGIERPQGTFPMS